MKNKKTTIIFPLLILLFILLYPFTTLAQAFEWIASQPVNYTHNPDMIDYTDYYLKCAFSSFPS